MKVMGGHEEDSMLCLTSHGNALFFAFFLRPFFFPSPLVGVWVWFYGGIERIHPLVLCVDVSAAENRRESLVLRAPRAWK